MIARFVPMLDALDGSVVAGGGYVYWTNSDFGSVGRASVRGGNINQRLVTVTGAGPRIGSVAVGAGHVYWRWTDIFAPFPAPTYIGRANLDGTSSQPTWLPASAGVALVVGGPYLFSVQGGHSPSLLARMKLDGSDAVELALPGEQELQVPFAVAANGDALYFVVVSTIAPHAPAVGRMGFNGGAVQYFLRGINTVFGLAVDSSHLYWGSFRGIGRSSLNGAKANFTFIPLPNTPALSPTSVAVDSYGPAPMNQLSVSPRRFHAAASGPSVGRLGQRYGATVSYSLEKAETVNVTIAKPLLGRKQRGRCVSATTQNQRAKPCTRLVPLRGSLTLAAIAGRNAFRFTGRLAGRKLKPGLYRLTARPIADGSTDLATTTSFEITN